MMIKAYAKINLTLDITGLRPDGYHAISSVMVPVSLADNITIEKSDSFSFQCNLPALCTEDNLCVRSAKAFFQRSGVQQSASIYLEKNIPFPAGLGGGSSDAAAVIKGLNELFCNPLSEQELFDIAASVGSDVPFCLFGSPALCRGRGELLTPLTMKKAYHVVISIGDSRLSTAEVYRRFDDLSASPAEKSPAFVQALADDNEAEMLSNVSNSFELVTDIICPETKLMRELMLEGGAIISRLSGSGPSVYGLFADEESAIKGALYMKSKGFSAYNCTTLVK